MAPQRHFEIIAVRACVTHGSYSDALSRNCETRSRCTEGRFDKNGLQSMSSSHLDDILHAGGGGGGGGRLGGVEDASKMRGGFVAEMS